MKSATDTGEHERRFEAEQILFRQGEPAREVVVLRTGAVRLSRALGDREVTIAVLGPGALVGEDGLVAGVHGATAAALEPSTGVAVDGEALEAMVADGGELAVRIVRVLLDRLHDAGDRVALLARPSAGRLAMTLGRLAADIGRADAEGTLIPRRLRDVAGDVGLDEAALAEASKLLLREGLVRIKKNGIVVPGAERMYEFGKAFDASRPEGEPRRPMRSDGA